MFMRTDVPPTNSSSASAGLDWTDWADLTVHDTVSHPRTAYRTPRKRDRQTDRQTERQRKKEEREGDRKRERERDKKENRGIDMSLQTPWILYVNQQEPATRQWSVHKNKRRTVMTD